MHAIDGTVINRNQLTSATSEQKHANTFYKQVFSQESLKQGDQQDLSNDKNLRVSMKNPSLTNLNSGRLKSNSQTPTNQNQPRG